MSHDERPASLKIFDELKHAAIRGWQELKIAGHRAIARVNPHVGLLEVWVTVTKPDGKGGEKLCYEQPKIFENQGVIVVIHDDDDRLVFVKNYRQVGDRLPGIPLTRYVQTLQKNPSLLSEALAKIGCWQWELPRGTMMHATSEQEALSDRELIYEIARLEAREEAGCELEALEFVGWLHADTAFRPHPWAVVRARMVSRGERRPEENEFLGAVECFTPTQVRERIDDGSLSGGTVLAALLMAGIQIPPSPRR